MKRIIASLAAAGVLVAGAFVASTVASSEASAQTDETAVTTDEAARPYRGAVLDGVLDELVTDGTLNQGQADAVTDAVAVKRAEIRELREERRANRAEIHEQLEEWLTDGVITAEELAQLDVELPLHEDGPLAEALEDGQITQAEWDAFHEERNEHRQARRGGLRDWVTG